MDFNNLSPEMQQQRIEQTRQQYLVQAQQEMDRLRQGLDPGTVLTQDNLPAGQSSSRDIVTGWSGYRSPGGIASAGENMPRPSFNETSHQYPASFGQGMMGPYGGMSGPAMPNYAAQQLNQWTQERERYNAALRSGTGYLPKPGVIKPKKRKDTTMKQFDAWSRSNRPKVPATRQVPTGWNTRR